MKGVRVLLWPVFALSCGILGYEIGLMRVLLYASWYHFAFLVISIALLGFGASGTILCLWRDWFVRKGVAAFFVLALATAIAMPVSLQLVRSIPVEARFVPVLLTEQVLRWLLYWSVLSLPFLLGAMAIGLALILAGPRVPTVYAVNLAGSAVGAVVATLLTTVSTPEWLGAWMGAVVLTGVIPMTRQWGQLLTVTASVAAAAAWLAADHPRIRVDAYKSLAQIHRLQRDGDAHRIGESHGPRGVVELWAGSSFHDLPFIAPGESPPPITPIVVDGHSVGSLLRVADESEAGVVDHSLMSLPYEFSPAKPRVLLLGETGGANIWLAVRRGAAAVDVVQPHKRLVELVARSAGARGGHVFDRANVTFDTPRHFVTSAARHFDLIQLVTMESWAVETGGIGGLSQDHLITVQGLTACLNRLSNDGILAVGRGIQLPPRDNIKILNTLAQALRAIDVEQPHRHVVILRDYLAVCTMVKRTPWSGDEIEAVRRVASSREMTPVYFAGIRNDELNHPDHLPGPNGSPGDWLHHASTELLAGDAETFVGGWAFDIRAPTDERPFFGNFTKLGAIGELRRAYGDLWMTRTELALLFVFAAMIVIAVAGLALMIVPLVSVRAIRQSRALSITAVYFTAIGLAYLIIEIALLSRLTHLLGDPLLAGTAAIAGFLFFSGAGSLAAERLSRAEWLPRIIVVLVAVAVLDAWLLRLATQTAASWPTGARLGLAAAMVGPLGFLMGFPMPMALRRLGVHAPELVPWAWGVNGFASVLAPPLATAIGMAAGFSLAGSVAVVCYLIAAAVFLRLPGPKPPFATQT